MMRAAFFVISLFIVFSAFPHLFHTKILYLESLRVTKSYFGIEVLTFRACQGNLSNFFNRIKFSHFCLCLVGRNFWLLTAWELPLPVNVLLRSSSTFDQGLLFLLAVLAVDDLLFLSEQLAEKQVNSMARPAQIVVQVLRFLPNWTDML